MNLLYIWDKRKNGKTLCYKLKRNSFVVDLASDSKKGIEMALSGEYDVILLDRNLPGDDSIKFLKEIRELGLNTPVLLVATRATSRERIEGLDAGADDYLVKPFYLDELLARLRALTRRKTRELKEDIINVAGLTLNPLKCEVKKENERGIIYLTLKETLLLELLMRNYGQIIKKEVILEKVWGYTSEHDLSIVDLYIHYLRKKLNIYNIKTYRGIGYCFQAIDNKTKT